MGSYPRKRRVRQDTKIKCLDRMYFFCPKARTMMQGTEDTGQGASYGNVTAKAKG